MTTNAVDLAVLAVIAKAAGDPSSAEDHLRAARREARSMARRERQLVEIASLLVDGADDRAGGLTVEHASEFPDDADLLASLLSPPGREDERLRRRAW
jgi:hypothetical protein